MKTVGIHFFTLAFFFFFFSLSCKSRDPDLSGLAAADQPTAGEIIDVPDAGFRGPVSKDVMWFRIAAGPGIQYVSSLILKSELETLQPKLTIRRDRWDTAPLNLSGDRFDANFKMTKAELSVVNDNNSVLLIKISDLGPFKGTDLSLSSRVKGFESQEVPGFSKYVKREGSTITLKMTSTQDGLAKFMAKISPDEELVIRSELGCPGASIAKASFDGIDVTDYWPFFDARSCRFNGEFVTSTSKGKKHELTIVLAGIKPAFAEAELSHWKDPNIGMDKPDEVLATATLPIEDVRVHQFGRVGTKRKITFHFKRKKPAKAHYVQVILGIAHVLPGPTLGTPKMAVKSPSEPTVPAVYRNDKGWHILEAELARDTCVANECTATISLPPGIGDNDYIKIELGVFDGFIYLPEPSSNTLNEISQFSAGKIFGWKGGSYEAKSLAADGKTEFPRNYLQDRAGSTQAAKVRSENTVLPMKLSSKIVFNEMESIRSKTHDTLPRGVTKGETNTYGAIAMYGCLSGNAAPHWSDLQLHYYCQLPWDIRECYTETIRWQASTVGGKIQDPATSEAERNKLKIEFSTLLREKSFRYCLNRGKEGKNRHWKWFAENSDLDIFRYIMDSQTFAWDLPQMQVLLNSYYNISRPGDFSWLESQAGMEECKARRPRRKIDPEDGTHCLIDKTFLEPMQSAGR